MTQKIKAGPLTLALGLVVLGLGMLAYNFGGLGSPQAVWRFWPLLLIGLGAEYFIRRLTAKDREVVFHLPSVFLIGFLILAGVVVNALPAAGISQILDETIFNNRLSYTRQWRSDPVALEEGSRLRVENKTGRLAIRQSADGKLHAYAEIVAYGPTEEKARAEAGNREVIIEKGSPTRVYTRQNAASPNLPGGSINLTLEIPPGLDIEVTNESGEVTADKIAARLNVRTSNGAVMIGGLDGDLEVRGENGRITVHDVGGKVRVSTGNGQIRVENPRGEVALDSQNGEIELSSDHPLDKTYSLRTKNGRIRFSLPKESNLEIEARTSHGQISGLDQEFSTGSGPAGSARLKLGGGKGNARLSTENGPISVMTN